VPPGEVLRVLMVIARPAGGRDVGYQMVARPLLERLGAVRGKVALDVLRPPTLPALGATLRAAADAGTPYHILHFDGHGTFGVHAPAAGHSQHQLDAGTAERGFLVFEKPGGGQDLVSADTFALTVSQGQVPLVVLNACRSGMLGETAVEAAVATQLLEGGAASVVAMGYSVYAVAAAEFMTAFYEALFSGKAVSEAVAAGRQRLFQNKLRPSPKGLLELEDWMVPVHYLRRLIRFPQLQQSRPAGCRRSMRCWMRPARTAAGRRLKTYWRRTAASSVGMRRSMSWSRHSHASRSWWCTAPRGPAKRNW
jgi:hypothetical protein